MMDFYSANLLMFSAAMGFSVVASIFDLRTGEIPDKFTIGLVVVALSLRAVFSAFLGDINYLLDGALVGGLFFAFGALLFYTGGWGGGDAKLIAGIGAALGGILAPSILDSTFTLFPPFFGFFMALSIAAIPYSLTYALILSIRVPKVFSLTKKRMQENWMLMALALIFSISATILLNPYNFVLLFSVWTPPLFYLLMVYVKVVEEVAMRKDIPLKELQEGDMVAEDLIIKGKKIASKRDMDGLSKEVLAKLKKMKGAPKKVTIKWGIRFAPAFPIALIISPFWTAILFYLV